MSITKKTIVSVGIPLTLAVGLLAGCGENDNSDKNASSNSSSNAETTSSTPAKKNETITMTTTAGDTWLWES